jgi:ribosomal protein S18 acetylase RimI-like enzyme
VDFHLNTSSIEQISTHLKACDALFVPKLSSYVTIESYAEKLFDKAERIECFEGNELLALLAFYVNLAANFCFITNVSVVEKWRGKKIGDYLLFELDKYCLENNIRQIQLEVRKENSKAISFYKKHNFAFLKENVDNFELQKTI